MGPSKATWAASLCEMPSLRRGRRPHHVRKERVGTREVSCPAKAPEPTGPHREGEKPKPMMHGHEKSDSAIVAMKPPNKDRVTGRGGGGAKGGGQGEREPMPHVPDIRAGKACHRRRSAYGRPRGPPSIIRGGSRMQESCTYGSVRGAPCNGCPYRNRCLATAISAGAFIRR